MSTGQDQYYDKGKDIFYIRVKVKEYMCLNWMFWTYVFETSLAI